jgi:hypothetical protein
VNTGILLVMLWTTCQCVVSQSIEFPAHIGSPCVTDDRCNTHIQNSFCRNDICACKLEYVPNAENVSCLRVASNINDSCELAIQCTDPFGQYAECNSSKVCSCKAGYHFILSSKQCIPSKGLDETCISNFECFLPVDGSNQHVECAGLLCKCITGYNRSSDSRSCNDAAATKIISITCLIGVWILHLLM